jgi:hypothetical protein
MFSGLFVFRNDCWEKNVSGFACLQGSMVAKERFYIVIWSVHLQKTWLGNMLSTLRKLVYRKQCFQFVHFPETSLGNNVSTKVFPIYCRGRKNNSEEVNNNTKVCTMNIRRSLIAHTCPKTSMELMTPFSSLSRIVSMARKTPVLPTPALEYNRQNHQLRFGYFGCSVTQIFQRICPVILDFRL